jgi:hypothetical protein
MENALLRRLIQCADGTDEGSFGFRDAGIDGSSGTLYCDTGGSAINAVAQTTFVILAVTLDLGLNISHLLPPKNNPIAGSCEYFARITQRLLLFSKQAALCGRPPTKSIILLEAWESVQITNKPVLRQPKNSQGFGCQAQLKPTGAQQSLFVPL